MQAAHGGQKGPYQPLFVVRQRLWPLTRPIVIAVKSLASAIAIVGRGRGVPRPAKIAGVNIKEHITDSVASSVQICRN